MQKTQTSPHSHLESFRKSNLEIFKQRPIKKSKYTSISKLEQMLNAKKEKFPLRPHVSEGPVKILSLHEALEKMPEKISEIASKEEIPRDQFEAYLNSHFSGGYVAIIGKESDGKTIILQTTIPNDACAKCFVIIEPNVTVSIIENVQSEANALLAQTIHVGEGSKLTFSKLHNESGGAIEYQQCIVEKDAELQNCNAWFSGNLVRAKTSNILEGNGSSAKEYSLLLSKKSEHFDLNYTSVHRGQGTFSHCVFKSALKDESKNVFDGMIKIEPTASKTNALLECHSMILGNSASSNQIPGLEIKTDDVKATHSATVARIDDEEIFYLQSRGIDEKEAKRIIVKSFLESIVFMLPENVREPINKKIESNL